VGDILTIDRAVSAQFGERQVVGIKRKEPEPPELTWEEWCQPVAVQLGKTRDRDVLEVQLVLLGEARAGARKLLKQAELVERNDLDIVDVASRASQPELDRSDEAAETVQFNGLGERIVDVPEELPPGRGEFRRRSGEPPRSSL
jgi:hypothetical protein